jgi:D-galactarolactone cycloisomerase
MNLLADHIIDRIESHTLERVYPRRIGWNAKNGPHGQRAQVAVCQVFTDQGASGWGFCAVTEEEERRFIGRSVAELFDPATGSTLEALSIDRALHDLAGKILGQPVWRMLGGCDGRIPVYSGAIYFDDLNPQGEAPGTDALLAACDQDAAAGHAHFKLKIGRGFRYMDKAAGEARDVEVTHLVRAHFPDAHILVDANDGYTPEGICAYLKQVATCKLYWVEEPFEENNIEGLQRLRAAIQKSSPGYLSRRRRSA